MSNVIQFSNVHSGEHILSVEAQLMIMALKHIYDPKDNRKICNYIWAYGNRVLASLHGHMVVQIVKQGESGTFEYGSYHINKTMQICYTNDETDKNDYYDQIRKALEKGCLDEPLATTNQLNYKYIDAFLKVLRKLKIDRPLTIKCMDQYTLFECFNDTYHVTAKIMGIRK